jgi:hypothetical protein
MFQKSEKLAFLSCFHVDADQFQLAAAAGVERNRQLSPELCPRTGVGTSVIALAKSAKLPQTPLLPKSPFKLISISLVQPD